MKIPAILVFAISLQLSFAQDDPAAAVTTANPETSDAEAAAPAQGAKKPDFDYMIVKESQVEDHDETYKHSVANIDDKTILGQDGSQVDAVNAYESSKKKAGDQTGSQGNHTGAESDDVSAASVANARASSLRYGKVSHAKVEETGYHKSGHLAHNKEAMYKSKAAE